MSSLNLIIALSLPEGWAGGWLDHLQSYSPSRGPKKLVLSAQCSERAEKKVVRGLQNRAGHQLRQH